MKKFIALTFVLFSLLGWGISIWMYKYNLDLQVQIDQREKLLKDSKGRDSVYASKTKEYSEVITKYIEDCNIVYAGKKLNTSEVIKLWTNDIKEKESLNRQIDLLNRRLDLIKRQYGINYHLSYSDGKYSFSDSSDKKVDSGLILLPYYRDKLRYDSIKKVWIITTSN